MIKPTHDMRSQILNHFMPINKLDGVLPNQSSLRAESVQCSVEVSGTNSSVSSSPGTTMPCTIVASESSNTIWNKQDILDQHIPPKKRRRKQSIEEENLPMSKQHSDNINVTDVIKTSSFLSPSSLQLNSTVAHNQQMWTNTWSTGTRMAPWPQQVSYPFAPSLVTTPPPTPSPPIQCYNPRLYTGQGAPQYQSQLHNPQNYILDNPYRNVNSGFSLNVPYQYQRPPFTPANRWYGPGANYSLYGMIDGDCSGGTFGLERPTAPDTPVSPAFQDGNTAYQCMSVGKFAHGNKNSATHLAMDSVGTPYTTSTYSQQTDVQDNKVLEPPRQHLEAITAFQDDSETTENKTTTLDSTTVQPDVVSVPKESNTHIDSPRTFYNLDLQPPKATSSPIERDGSPESSDGGTRSISPVLPVSDVVGIGGNATENSWLHNLLGEPTSDIEEEANDHDWGNSSS